ncbi:MAG TPA: hypothetical protein ENK43_16810 [Planctomycetes bacterium]|nr:hypothetical protein [Planctomycetota bacterium]
MGSEFQPSSFRCEFGKSVVGVDNVLGVLKVLRCPGVTASIRVRDIVGAGVISAYVGATEWMAPKDSQAAKEFRG